jgi:hypothetical protein
VYACLTIKAGTYKLKTHCILINFLIIIRDLRWTEEVEEALTIFSFCDRFSVL